MSDQKNNLLLKKIFKSTILESVLRPIEPLLVFICAGLYVGGTWGEFKLYESCAYVLYRICVFGFNQGLVWYESEVPEKQFLRSFFQISMFSLTLCLISIGIVCLFFNFFPNFLTFLNLPTSDILDSQLMFFLLAVPCMVLSDILLHACMTRKKFFHYGIIHIFLRPCFIFGIPILGYLLSSSFLSFAFSFFVGNLISFLLSLIAFVCNFSIRLDMFTWNIFPYKKLFKYTFPLALSQWISVFCVRMDIFMLAGMTTLKHVEVYTIALTISKSFGTLIESLSKFLHYFFSNMTGKSLTDQVKVYFNYVTWLVCLFQAIGFIIILFFGRWMLELIHPSYLDGYSVILIVATFIYINSHFSFVGTVLSSLGMTFVFPFLLAFSLLSNAILNYVLIPIYDVNGAAIALSVTNFFVGLLVILALYQKTKKQPFSFYLILNSFITILLLLTIYFIFVYCEINSIANVFLIFLVILLFFAVHYMTYKKLDYRK